LLVKALICHTSNVDPKDSFMQSKSFSQRIAQWLLIAMLLGAGLAMAQSEPNMAQIYATAQAGKLDDAQAMIQQVLLAHPKSSKALFVQAELYARQGRLGNARASLASAETLSPGLPFAKPDAVRALRTQLASRPVTSSGVNAPAHYAAALPPAPCCWQLG
jgi:thioredoxin-like negative regulator of GroEL